MLAPGFVPRSTAVAAHLSQQQGPGVGEESIKPMDLSSGGLAASCAPLASSHTCSSLSCFECRGPRAAVHVRGGVCAQLWCAVR